MGVVGVQLTSEAVAALAVLADGIIPPDSLDAGAREVNAAGRLAEKVAAGVNSGIYSKGLETTQALARERFGMAVGELNGAQVHELLSVLRDTLPAFFKQLRMDVSALYLSDEGVWQRIGFPGPSTASGGYPDFDRPQTVTFRGK